MKIYFDYLSVARQHMANMVEKYDLKTLNHIPDGFNNNLIWNFGHVVVTQQLLNYGLSGIESKVPNDLINKYRKGSQPEAAVSEEEVKTLLKLSANCLEMLTQDYENGVFKTFKEYSTSFGVTLSNIEEAIAFNNIHEGLHLGYMMSMRKLMH